RSAAGGGSNGRSVLYIDNHTDLLGMPIGPQILSANHTARKKKVSPAVGTPYEGAPRAIALPYLAPHGRANPILASAVGRRGSRSLHLGAAALLQLRDQQAQSQIRF